MATQPKEFITAERYLELERAANHRSEYKDGVVYAMPGGTPNHSSICVNLVSELRSCCKNTGCTVFNGDLKVFVPASALYTYPDASIVCGALELKGSDVLLNPVLLAEVLSDSTRGYDQGDKFHDYRSIQSFREYLLIEQTKVSIQHWFLREGLWTLLAEYKALTDEIELHFTAGVRLSVAGVYDGIQFASQSTQTNL
jgi:Uma2 family endonuclease